MKPLISGIALFVMSGYFMAAGRVENPVDIPRGMGQMDMRRMCPASLPGVEISTANTISGISVTFTAAAENVAELQKRVEQMASMHNMMVGSASMPMPNHMPAGEVAYEPLANGARLTFKPKNPAELPEFRKQIESHINLMKKGDCTMMGGMMQGMDHPMHNDAPAGK